MKARLGPKEYGLRVVTSSRRGRRLYGPVLFCKVLVVDDDSCRLHAYIRPLDGALWLRALMNFALFPLISYTSSQWDQRRLRFEKSRSDLLCHHTLP